MKVTKTEIIQLEVSPAQLAVVLRALAVMSGAGIPASGAAIDLLRELQAASEAVAAAGTMAAPPKPRRKRRRLEKGMRVPEIAEAVGREEPHA